MIGVPVPMIREAFVSNLILDLVGQRSCTKSAFRSLLLAAFEAVTAAVRLKSLNAELGRPNRVRTGV